MKSPISGPNPDGQFVVFSVLQPGKIRACREDFPWHERSATTSSSSIPLPQIPLTNSAVLPSGSVPRRQPNHPCPSASGARRPGAGRWPSPPLPLFSRAATGTVALRFGCGFAAVCTSYLCGPSTALDSVLAKTSGPNARPARPDDSNIQCPTSHPPPPGGVGRKENLKRLHAGEAPALEPFTPPLKAMEYRLRPGLRLPIPPATRWADLMAATESSVCSVIEIDFRPLAPDFRRNLFSNWKQ